MAGCSRKARARAFRTARHGTRTNAESGGLAPFPFGSVGWCACGASWLVFSELFFPLPHGARTLGAAAARRPCCFLAAVSAARAAAARLPNPVPAAPLWARRLTPRASLFSLFVAERGRHLLAWPNTVENQEVFQLTQKTKLCFISLYMGNIKGVQRAADELINNIDAEKVRPLASLPAAPPRFAALASLEAWRAARPRASGRTVRCAAMVVLRLARLIRAGCGARAVAADARCCFAGPSLVCFVSAPGTLRGR